MHKQRIFTSILSLAGVVSAFLPWLNAPLLGSVSGTQGSDGWIAVAIFLMGLMFSLIGMRSRQLSMVSSLGVVLTGVLGTGLAALKIADIYKMHPDVGGGELAAALSQAIGVGIGLWLMALVGVLLVVGAVFAGHGSRRT